MLAPSVFNSNGQRKPLVLFSLFDISFVPFRVKVYERDLASRLRKRQPAFAVLK